MKCKQCGAEIRDGVKFCGECGAKVLEAKEEAKTAEPPKAPEQKSSWLKTAGKVVGGLAILAMIGSCMSDKEGTKTKTSSTPAKVVAQLNADQVNFLKTVGITDPVVTSDSGKVKNFKAKGNEYRLTVNDKNGVTKVVKLIGGREWYVWTDDHGKWDVPENDGKYIVVDIDDMNGQLKQNAARASKNYKGVDVKFTGWIVNIDSDGDYISVRGRDRYAFLTSFHCNTRNKKIKEVVLNKNKNSQVTIKGQITDVGEIMGYRVKVEEIK